MARDGFGLHFVNVRVNGLQGIFLVDTGASHTVLDHRFARRCLDASVPSNLRLAWLGAENADTREGVVREIQIGPHIQQGAFLVYVLNLDSINHAPSREQAIRLDGILGADFLISHGALIDYPSQALRFNRPSSPWLSDRSSRASRP